MFIFLPSFEKERRKTNQKEERKTVVVRKGLPKTSLKKHERSFKEQRDATAIISTKMLIHIRIFGMYSVELADVSLFVGEMMYAIF